LAKTTSKTYKINNEHTHLSQLFKERIKEKEKYAENGHEHKMSCLKCLKFSKKKYDKVFAENHEKMLNKHIRQRNMLELFVRKKKHY